MSSVIISSLTSPTSDMLSFTGLSLSSYRVLTLSVWGLTVGTDDAEVQFRVSQSGSFLSGASDYSFMTTSRSSSGSLETAASNASSLIGLTDTALNWGVGNAAGETYAVRLELVGLEPSEPRYFTYAGAYVGPTGSAILVNGQGVINNSTEIDGLRILLSTGTMPAGKAVLIGHT